MERVVMRNNTGALGSVFDRLTCIDCEMVDNSRGWTLFLDSEVVLDGGVVLRNGDPLFGVPALTVFGASATFLCLGGIGC